MISAERLSSTPTLWYLFAAVVLITASFPVVSSFWDLTLVDGISDPTLTRETIASMSSDQRAAHAWITSTLDVAYPLAYGAFFAGSALAFFPSLGRYLAMPSYLVIPVDLAEGVVQVLALTGITDWVDLKAFLTPLKTVLFLAGLFITVCGWLTWLFRKVKHAAS